MADLTTIGKVLAAYRSTEAHITEDEITAAWAEYEAACDKARWQVGLDRIRKVARGCGYSVAVHGRRAVTTDELKTVFGGPINPKWVFVLVGHRLFGRLDRNTWHEYESER